MQQVIIYSLNFGATNIKKNMMELHIDITCREKTCLWVSEQVRHKLNYSDIDTAEKHVT